MGPRIYVQVPASCTLPAAPPWPEEAIHPLAALPIIRQANGVETTQGSFYEVHAHSSDPLMSQPQWCSLLACLMDFDLSVFAPFLGSQHLHPTLSKIPCLAT